METIAKRPKLLVIVGPTASGKSKLAMKVASEFSGEIITADSRTIYKGMDIGSAKPSPNDQKSIPHWGLDLIEPGQRYSAAQFKKYAINKIKEIMVGGTGLYIDAVVFDYKFPEIDTELRQKLELLSLPDLQQIITYNRYEMPKNYKNKRHLMGIVERKGKNGAKALKPDKGTLIVGLSSPDSDLKATIKKRAELLFASGLLEEANTLINTYGESTLNLTSGIAYKSAFKVLQNKISLQTAVDTIAQEEWQYARRQRTWLRSNIYIQWFDNREFAYKFIVGILNK
jgi:tRNA dimethylallyltransferase